MYRLLLLAVAMTPISSVANPREDIRKPLEILFIGNSYTYFNELPEMLVELARAAGTRPLRYRTVTFGGATLAGHWADGGGDAVRAIHGHRPDIVVLQEQSQLPLAAPDFFQRFVRLFDERIRKVGARTLLYVTWAPRDAPEEQQGLTAAYAAVARERRATLVPVGPAWRAVLRGMPGMRLHDADGRHPNPTGSYVAALTFFAVLYGRSPEGLPARLGKERQPYVELEPEKAASLQRLVWETVRAQAG